jgi:hypothetical protein
MRRWQIALLALVGVFVVGCVDTSTPSRTIRGQISLSNYHLAAPAVVVESARHVSYVAPLSSTGKFLVAVPSGQSYRLTLTDRTSSGQLELVSRVLWTVQGKTFAWAKVSAGAPINFGVIHPVGTPSALAGTSSGGSQGDDDCDDDDDSQGDEQGEASGGTTCTPPPPSNPPLCSPGPSNISNSQGDDDDDAQGDNNNQGDDDRDGNCADGGVVSANDDDNAQGDNNNQGEDGDDDGNSGQCAVHIPPCPPATTDGGTPPPTPPPPTPPPAPSPDLGAPPIT